MDGTEQNEAERGGSHLGEKVELRRVEERELNVEIINAFLTGLYCFITQNFIFFLFKKLSFYY